MLKVWPLLILFIWIGDENVGQSANNRKGMLSLSDQEIEERRDYGRRASLANDMRRKKGIIRAVNSPPIDYRSWIGPRPLTIQSRVVDGSDADPEPFGFYAQLIDYGTRSICGGTAIDQSRVITAAHCVYDWVNLSPDDLRFAIYTGSIDSQRGDYTTWKKIVVHERYLELMKSEPNDVGKRRKYDIAIIVLKDQVARSNMIPLASKRGDIGIAGDFAGFGVSAYLSEGENMPSFPSVLQVARKLPILDESIDERDSSFFTKNVGREGDSGGPYIWKENGKQVLGGLYVDDIVMGDKQIRSEFLQIADYRGWIDTQKLNKEEL